MGLRRGLNNIRTLAGRVDQVAAPYRTYMQITCLEMEKARRGAERRNASQRMAAIDARVAEIEADKAILLKRLENPRANAPVIQTPQTTRVAPPAGRQKSAPAFRIRY